MKSPHSKIPNLTLFTENMTVSNWKSKRKLVKIVLCTIFLLCTIQATSAHASDGGGGGEGGEKQSPAQVMMQIVGSAIFLKVLDHYGLP